MPSSSEYAASNTVNNWFRAKGRECLQMTNLPLGAWLSAGVAPRKAPVCKGGRTRIVKAKESVGRMKTTRTTRSTVPRVDLPLPPMICDGVAYGLRRPRGF